MSILPFFLIVGRVPLLATRRGREYVTRIVGLDNSLVRPVHRRKPPDSKNRRH